jgi:hypothetical protein
MGEEGQVSACTVVQARSKYTLAEQGRGMAEGRTHTSILSAAARLKAAAYVALPSLAYCLAQNSNVTQLAASFH